MTKHHTSEEIRRAIANHGGNITAAGESLGMKRAAIYSRIKNDPSLTAYIEEQRAQAEANREAERLKEIAAHDEVNGGPEELPDGSVIWPDGTMTTQERNDGQTDAPTGNPYDPAIRHADRLKKAPLPEQIPLSNIAKTYKRQAGENIRLLLNDFIRGYGIPRDQAAIFDVIDYMTKVSKGEA